MPCIPKEHNFGKLNLTQFEEAVFDDAVLFRVNYMQGRGTRQSWTFPTLEEGIAKAKEYDRGTVLYCVAKSGRAIVLDQKDWPKWEARQAANKGE